MPLAIKQHMAELVFFDTAKKGKADEPKRLHMTLGFEITSKAATILAAILQAETAPGLWASKDGLSGSTRWDEIENLKLKSEFKNHQLTWNGQNVERAQLHRFYIVPEDNGNILVKFRATVIDPPPEQISAFAEAERDTHVLEVSYDPELDTGDDDDFFNGDGGDAD